MTWRINRCSHCGCDEPILGIDGKLYCDNCGMRLEEGLTMRFKVGDKVKVKDNLKINTSYGNLCYVQSMEKYADGIFEIKSIDKASGFYTLSIPAPYDTWTDEMLDPVAEDSAKKQKREIILSAFKKMTDDDLAYAYASVVKCSECPFQTKCREHETVECLKRIKSWLEISQSTKQTWKY